MFVMRIPRDMPPGYIEQNLAVNATNSSAYATRGALLQFFIAQKTVDFKSDKAINKTRVSLELIFQKQFRTGYVTQLQVSLQHN